MKSYFNYNNSSIEESINDSDELFMSKSGEDFFDIDAIYTITPHTIALEITKYLFDWKITVSNRHHITLENNDFTLLVLKKNGKIRIELHSKNLIYGENILSFMFVSHEKTKEILKIYDLPEQNTV